MSILLVDIGNTRIKWAVLTAGRIGRQRALAHGGIRSAPQIMARMLRALQSRRPRIIGVRVASVAGARLDRELTRCSRELLGLTPRFVHSERRAGGVVNGYREVWRLGVDRWVAMIGARQIAPGRALCIVDVGTALTLDLVDAKGQHHGGAIVPGPALMIDALLRDTGGIRRRAIAPKRTARGLFARDTRAGLSAGARFAVAALIDRAKLEARASLGRMPLLLLTGGAASSLRGTLRSPHRIVPDLVLRGLGVLAVNDPRR